MSFRPFSDTRLKRLKIWAVGVVLHALPMPWKLACFRWFFRRRCSRPRTFFERLHWNLLQRYDERLVKTSDKIGVRDYVASKVGSKYLTKIYGVYESAKQIPFSTLPEKYVLKANHGSGWNVFVRSKRQVQENEIRKKCDEWLKQVYSGYAEWWYGGIPAKLFAEEFLEDAERGIPNDYKFFVFRGQVGLVQVDTARFTDHRRNLYDPDWTPLESTLLYPRGTEIPRPAAYDEMKRVAEKLGEEFDFVRVDLYSVEGRVIFGEMTYFPECGAASFSSRELDAQMAHHLEQAIARGRASAR